MVIPRRLDIPAIPIITATLWIRTLCIRRKNAVIPSAQAKSQGEETKEPKTICEPEKITNTRKILSKNPLNLLNFRKTRDKNVKKVKKIIISFQDRISGSRILFSISGVWL